MRERTWPLWLAAGALVAIVWALLARSTEPLAGTGFERRDYKGAACAGAFDSSTAREPFVRETASGESRCVAWTSELVARTKMHARIEMTAEGGSASVTIDGRSVVFDKAIHPARTHQGTVDLARGVHVIVAQHVGDGAGAYYRIALTDELAPHNFEFAPPLDLDSFYLSAEEASRVLTSPEPPAERPTWPALFAALALTGAGTLAWLAVRRRRGRAVPQVDLAIAAAIFLAALFVRAHALDLEDTTWDELTYIDTASHWVRNVVLGDFNPEAWRFNLAHPPVTKWFVALGVALGGQTGARYISAASSALAAGMLFAFGRVAFGRAVGAVAGALAVFLPLWVAHGRIAGHESVVLVWWCGSMLALACWLRSLPTAGTPVERGDPLAAFMCVFAAAMCVLSRATGIWIVPLLAVVLLVRSRGALARGLLAVPLAAIAGGIAAVLLVVAGWPYLLRRPYDQLATLTAMAEAGKPRGDIEVYLGKLTLPAWHYFALAFAAETPALLLAAALGGVVVAFRTPARRSWGAVCLLWLLLPFAQSVSTLRIGAGRYMIQSWPALLLFAALALVALGEVARDFAPFFARAWARTALAALPAAFAVVYTGVALARVDPYPLDYFDELVGGPSGVAARKMFEVPWWGEGNLAAMTALTRRLPRGRG